MGHGGEDWDGSSQAEPKPNNFLATPPFFFGPVWDGDVKQDSPGLHNCPRNSVVE